MIPDIWIYILLAASGVLAIITVAHFFVYLLRNICVTLCRCVSYQVKRLFRHIFKKKLEDNKNTKKTAAESEKETENNRLENKLAEQAEKNICAKAVYIIYKFFKKLARKLVCLAKRIRVRVRKIGSMLWRMLGGGVNTRDTNKQLMIISMFLIFSIWCLRLAVGFFKVSHPGDICGECDGVVLTWYEEIFNSFVHALQTFSMDEDYTQYIAHGKQMMAVMFGKDSSLVGAYGVFASLLNAVAPVVGGAFIFQVIASIIPEIRLYISPFYIWIHEYFYFSELNEHSLALAQSICNEYATKFFKPMLIFTDTYIDDENEKHSEMIAEAKRLGAVCLKDDIVYIVKSGFGKLKFFLIDKDEDSNLQTLSELADKRNCKFLQGAEVYLFSQDDAYIRVEKTVRERLKAKNLELPDIIPVQSYRNLVSNLFVDIPLYEPLVSRRNNADGKLKLNVTILGTGMIGMQTFLAAYWFGQINDCELNINVVSKESAESFYERLDYLNPDILRSCNIDGTVIDHGDILRCDDSGAEADVYANIAYHQADVKTDDFTDIENDGKYLLDTDYFIVALGSDEENLSVAEKLNNIIGRSQFESGVRHDTVIAYVVYNSVLCHALNNYACKDANKSLFMYAFGCHEDVYSTRNIFMKDLVAKAGEINDSYHSHELNKKRHEVIDKRVKKDDYTYWANLARAMHVKYKMFSAGCIDFSVFTENGHESEAYNKKLRAASDAYLALLENSAKEHGNVGLVHSLAWLEHRRWNAFMRIKGFTSVRDLTKMRSQKDVELKLHACLVEMDKSGGGITINTATKKMSRTPSDIKKRTHIDAFDCMMVDLYDILCKASELKYIEELSNNSNAKREEVYFTDYRIYDYPFEDFPERFGSE